MRLALVTLLMIMTACFAPAHAAYFTHRPLPAMENSYAPSVHKAVAPGDSYKGIVAVMASGLGALSLLMALLIPAVGLIFPGFFLGLAGIIFGALPKKENRGLGRFGLILGIVDVLLVILFVAAVAIALASFT